MKTKNLLFKLIFGLLIISYLALYILNITGYYDKNIRNKVEFTNQMIDKFEEDVKEGKNIDIKNYIVSNNKDYSNNISNMGFLFSTKLEYILTNGIKDLIKFLSILFK